MEPEVVRRKSIGSFLSAVQSGICEAGYACSGRMGCKDCILDAPIKEFKEWLKKKLK